MAKRTRRMIACLLCVCLCLCVTSGAVSAASTAEVKQPIDTDRACRLTVDYGYDGHVFEEQTVQLYRVADVTADARYTLTPSFEPSGLTINGVQTVHEWTVVRSTLEALIVADAIAPTQTATTDAFGQACFEQLTPGLYMVSALDVVYDETIYGFNAVMVAVPGIDADGQWTYQAAVVAKADVIPPVHPDEELQLKVVKLWKGDEGRTDRPKSVEVEIFRDGVRYATVTLSADNNWSHHWSVKRDGADWTVVERRVPEGYTMTVEQRDGAFVVVNTRKSHTPQKPSQTGDTSPVWLYVILMIVSGSILVIVGMTGKRKRV